jgi:alpha 1,3-glucosidase
MVNDPFTLIIALDKSFTAEGRVYVDDGKGFGYLKGEFIDMKMVFDNDKFTVESGNVREGRFRFDCKVERVVVVGLGYAPSKISYQGRYLVFSIQGDVVTIKKPDVWISDQFEFKFSK